MSKYASGTIVLIPFPFTDLSSNKIRPALIVSRENAKTNDFTVAFVSSLKAINVKKSQFIIRDSDKDFVQTGLKTSSVIRCDKLATLDKKICLGRLGNLSQLHLKKVRTSLAYYFEI